jgi:hypothetical protein
VNWWVEKMAVAVWVAPAHSNAVSPGIQSKEPAGVWDVCGWLLGDIDSIINVPQALDG